ncbi:hypothetical protein LIX87_08360 [Weissella viridescens]|uniref:hypothetical protein n=1 Tax=Weissella viridescens TaxID=1629 RepID=UPI001D069E60|nr:hypothetical protein [Weissella viridescens]MCB6840999.1 hypothetical protein [Weissella viridescens]MCB6847733.1 hypothetical protein [Weissella viridescens]
MTYKLQDSSEETARIQVTDTYGLLPITNELLIALTYEGKDSDHVADALAQFELQAIDLSHSLGGDLTNSFNEAQETLDRPKDEPQETKNGILEDTEKFAEKAFNRLHELFQADELDAKEAQQQLHYLATSFDALEKLNPLGQFAFEEMQDELRRLNAYIDDSSLLGTVKVTIGDDSYKREERYEDSLDYIEQVYYSLDDFE